MITFQSFNEVQSALNNDTTTVVEITKNYLQNIAENQHLNAFIEVYEKEALQIAEAIDLKFKKQEHGLLAGLVVGIKDNICYEDHASTAASTSQAISNGP